MHTLEMLIVPLLLVLIVGFGVISTALEIVAPPTFTVLDSSGEPQIVPVHLASACQPVQRGEP